MRKNNEIIKMDSNGEIEYLKLHSDTKRLYQPDTPFYHPVAPYLMLLLCGLTDFFVFKSLFDLVDYTDPVMKAFSIIGLLIGFDVMPIFTGVHAKRISQGLSKDRFVLLIALFVSLLALVLNVELRMTTVDLLVPGREVTPVAISLAVFGCCLPVITSIASYVISYLTYNPLSIQKRRLEEAISEKEDEIRRFEAVITDYEADRDFPKRLEELDELRYREMLKLQRAKVVGYCDYVRQRLKEHLGDPAAHNALSKKQCEEILKKLDAELAALDAAV